MACTQSSRFSSNKVPKFCLAIPILLQSSESGCHDCVHRSIVHSACEIRLLTVFLSGRPKVPPKAAASVHVAKMEMVKDLPGVAADSAKLPLKPIATKNDKQQAVGVVGNDSPHFSYRQEELEHESPLDVSAARSHNDWKAKAIEGDFDEDLHIVDPQSHFHLLKQLERDVVKRSEYYQEGRRQRSHPTLRYDLTSAHDVLFADQHEANPWLIKKIFETILQWTVGLSLLFCVVRFALSRRLSFALLSRCIHCVGMPAYHVLPAHGDHTDIQPAVGIG